MAVDSVPLANAQTTNLRSSTGPLIGIPMYFYPGPQWANVSLAKAAVGTIVINPDSGPGNQPDPNYASAVKAAQANKIKVLGYVPTTYANGTVSLKQAMIWVNHYYYWYHVNGIYFDQVNSSCAPKALKYYTSLYDHVKAKPRGAIVVLSPGTSTGSCYYNISDILVTFEGNYTTYVNNYVAASWTAGLPKSHFWHIIYAAPSELDMENAVNLAVTRGADWVYVTDLGGSGANPYDSLPTYFTQEASYATSLA
ncbi:MAG: spherulation-specific family 4 protein [Nitrososphaerales archaeon]